MREDSVEVVRSEEQLTFGTRSVVSGSVRLSKRVVTEERTVTVTVRREQLVVERLPSPEGLDLDPSRVVEGGAPGAAAPVLELTLSEEEVEVVTRVVPRQRVRVHVDEVTEWVDVTESVDREHLDVDGDVVAPAGTPLP